MPNISRRKRKRATFEARGDRENPCALRTGKGTLFDWTQAGVRDLLMLQTAISTGRVVPDLHGCQLIDMIFQLVNSAEATTSQRIEGFRVIAVATARANLRRAKEPAQTKAIPVEGA